MMGMSAYAGMACCGKPHFCVYQGAGPADSPLSPQACEARVVELNIVEKWEQRRQLEIQLLSTIPPNKLSALRQDSERRS